MPHVKAQWCERIGLVPSPRGGKARSVKAALNSVVMGGLMAAGLTALMILLFLGNWRLTLIILATIPMATLDEIPDPSPHST
jgi:hypothetical protein